MLARISVVVPAETLIFKWAIQRLNIIWELIHDADEITKDLFLLFAWKGKMTANIILSIKWARLFRYWPLAHFIPPWLYPVL